MLARTVQSPETLGFTDKELTALLQVLTAMERGEIIDQQLDMSTVTHECGTPSCILGWARHFAKDDNLLRDHIRSPQLEDLFCMGTAIDGKIRDLCHHEIKVDHARQALTNFLAGSKTPWRDVR